MELLRVRDLSFAYSSATSAIFRDLNFSLEHNEIAAVVGPSGCGKTTLLRLVAALLLPDAGEVLVEGTARTEPGRDRGVLFQGDTCFKWLDVRRNIGFALESGQTEKVNDLLKIAGLTDVASKYPKDLSFGMRQRVSLMRTIAAGARLMLLDEPLSSVDALTTLRLQLDLRDLLRSADAGALWVTHDLEEALTVASRILVLSGRPAAIAWEYAPQVKVESVEDRLADTFVAEYKMFFEKALSTWKLKTVEARAISS